MEYKLRFRKCCCLSLSKACIILGLLYLVSNVHMMVQSSINLHEHATTQGIIAIVVGVIGFGLCVMMMMGSVKEKRWLMLPYIIWEWLIMGFLAFLIVMSIIRTITATDKDRKELGMVAVIFTNLIILVISLVYWNIVFSRYLEISDKQAARPDVESS